MAFRFSPAGLPQDYRTFQIHQPTIDTERPATCEEVDCEPFLKGWQLTVPIGSQDEHIIRNQNRPFQKEVVGGMITFRFAPGTNCFRSSTHRVVRERPALFVVREGDYRGNPRGTAPKVVQPNEWRDRMIEDAEAVRERIEKG
jgi:hypothetical protein